MENKRPLELEDDMLDQVAGGAAMSGKTVSNDHTCEHFVCCWCGNGKAFPGEASHGCTAQGHGLLDPTPDGNYVRVEAVFSNTCEWCEYQSCGTCTYGG